MTITHMNPPPTGDIAAPPRIEKLLRRACYDCHSNETRWPWYSYIAPVSWLIARDVELGRKEINFSEWASYYHSTRLRKVQRLGRTLREEAMPPWTYRILHRGVGLTDQELAALEQWTKSEIARQQRLSKINVNKEN